MSTYTRPDWDAGDRYTPGEYETEQTHMLAELRAAEVIIADALAYAAAMRMRGLGTTFVDCYGRPAEATLAAIRQTVRRNSAPHDV